MGQRNCPDFAIMCQTYITRIYTYVHAYADINKDTYINIYIHMCTHINYTMSLSRLASVCQKFI